MFRFVFLLICIFSAVSGLQAQDLSCGEHYCVAVVDAGSTGSRAHIYSYDLDKTNSPVNINEVWSKKIKPGLATIEPNQNTIYSYLHQLFSDAPEQNMPVYFYATAGMRLLPQPKQQVYYQWLQQWFAQQSQWQLIDAKTITGKQEGVFDWLSMSYQSGALLSNEKEAPGVIDIGGASTQIVFPVQNNTQIKEADKEELDLYGRHLTLFVHSFLGLGQTEVTHQFLDVPACFANDYQMPDGLPAQGDAVACEHEVDSLMNDVHNVNKIVQPALTANPVDSWYVMGGIVNLAEDKLFQFDNNQLTNQSLIEQADREVCHQQWDILNKKFPDNEYLYGYCLFASYYYSLMVDGYGLNPEQTIKYMTGNKTADWTLGVVLHHNS